MIKTQNLVPSVYYNQSRDFQLFGRIYDIIFNYAKTNVDLMDNFPINQNMDSKLLELLSRTLGFEARANYHNKDLNAICSVFIQLMKEKGSVVAVERLVRTILNSENIAKRYSIQQSAEDYPLLEIYLPDVITNSEIALLENVLDYILPAGVLYTLKEGYLDNSVDALQLKNISNVGSYNLVTEDNSKVTNISIATSGTSVMNTKELATIGSVADVAKPISGDIRYSKVTATDSGK